MNAHVAAAVGDDEPFLLEVTQRLAQGAAADSQLFAESRSPPGALRAGVRSRCSGAQQVAGLLAQRGAVQGGAAELESHDQSLPPISSRRADCYLPTVDNSTVDFLQCRIGNPAGPRVARAAEERADVGSHRDHARARDRPVAWAARRAYAWRQPAGPWRPLTSTRTQRGRPRSSPPACNGADAAGLACDVTSADQVDAAVSQIERDLPPVAALVNNAGVRRPPASSTSGARTSGTGSSTSTCAGRIWSRAALLPGLLDRDYGRIVNLSSVSAVRGGGVFGGSHYSATKAAVLGLTRGLAREVGPQAIRLPFGFGPRADRDGHHRREALAGAPGADRGRRAGAAGRHGRRGRVDRRLPVLRGRRLHDGRNARRQRRLHIH